MYNHGFSTLALAEAYGYVHDDRIGPALQKAVDLILSSQRRNANHAWRYSPDSPDADTTVSGAQMVALFAARNAGIGVPENSIRQALRFFVDCQTPDGGFGYTNPGGPDGARTAIGALVLSLARQQKLRLLSLGDELPRVASGRRRRVITNTFSIMPPRLTSAFRPRLSTHGMRRM